MFTKALLIALVIVILLMWWRHSTIQRLKNDLMQQARQRPPSRALETAMVRCETCGVFLPVDEALSQNGLYYCCSEHAKKRTGR